MSPDDRGLARERTELARGRTALAAGGLAVAAAKYAPALAVPAAIVLFVVAITDLTGMRAKVAPLSFGRIEVTMVGASVGGLLALAYTIAVIAHG